MGNKILLVEDDEFLGSVIYDKLQKEGYETVFVKDGAEGMKAMKDHKPDLVLLDIILPTMNGYEILENKSKDEEISDIPVIIISNSGQPVEINRILTLGVEDYLIKAEFEPDEVLAKVRKHMDKKKKETESGPSGGGAQQLEGISVLSVEDDEFLGSLLARKLSAESGILKQVKTGEEAVSYLTQAEDSELPQIILLDIILPGLNGFEVLEKIKSDERLKSIPVILLSNLGQKSEIEKGKQYGAARFLVKATLSLDEVIDQIREVIAEG